MAKHGKNGIPNAYEVLKKKDEKKEGNKIVTEINSSVADILTENVYKKAAEICAKALKRLFLKMKDDDPMAKQFDLYKNSEGRDAIENLLKLAKNPNDDFVLLSYLDIKLKNLGLKGTPSHTHFIHYSENSSDDYYYVSFLDQDEIQEKKIEKCAENLIGLYRQFKLEKKGEASMYMNNSSKGWENIQEILTGVSDGDIMVMLSHLSKKLGDAGYNFIYPSPSYFKCGNAYISISKKAA